jgi:hypothetical protein
MAPTPTIRTLGNAGPGPTPPSPPSTRGPYGHESRTVGLPCRQSGPRSGGEKRAGGAVWREELLEGWKFSRGTVLREAMAMATGMVIRMARRRASYGDRPGRDVILV